MRREYARRTERVGARNVFFPRPCRVQGFDRVPYVTLISIPKSRLSARHHFARFLLALYSRPSRFLRYTEAAGHGVKGYLTFRIRHGHKGPRILAPARLQSHPSSSHPTNDIGSPDTHTRARTHTYTHTRDGIRSKGRKGGKKIRRQGTSERSILRKKGNGAARRSGDSPSGSVRSFPSEGMTERKACAYPAVCV